MHFTDTIELNLAATRATARLFVDPHWDYLRDHFPGTPVLPGLVMLQAAVHAASALLGGAADAAGAAELESLERLQVVRRVTPGETFIVETAMLERSGDGARALFTADGRVDEATAMRARF